MTGSPKRGDLVGRYTVLGPIGEGGMGVVVSAYDAELDRRVAVKLVRERLGASAEVRERLLREAKAMARLSHPNVVAVHDAGVAGGAVFIAMELVEGGTLRQWLTSAPRTGREVVRAFAAAGEGLAAAHAAGLVHRDFKPENVLVGRDGRVRVTDFGIARLEELPDTPPPAAAPAPAPLTSAGAVLGTPGYIAPEQLRGDRGDARSDQFAFCVALYEALFHRKPFPAEPAAFAQAVQAGAIAPMDRGVPARVRRALARGLAADPAARHPSMAALIAELRGGEARNRRIAVGAGVALLAAAIAGLAAGRAAAHAGLCRDGSAKLAGVWDPAARAEVERAFSATGRPFAAAAFAGAAAGLDAWAARFARARDEACAATRLRGEQSDEALDLRMACLDDQLRDASALVAALRKADAKTVERAVEAVGRLPALEGCADVAALRARVPPPSGAGQRARIEALKDELARAGADYSTGSERALAEAQAAVKDARAAGYDPALAEALLLEARAEADALRGREAAAAYVEAAEAALRGRDERAAAAAWLSLGWALRQVDARATAGTDFIGMARALSSRLGDRALEDAVDFAEGGDDLARGDLAGGLALLERSLAWRTATFGEGSLLTAKGHDALCRALRAAGRLAGARAEAERALAGYARAVGPAHPLYAGALGSLAAIVEDLGDEKASVELDAQSLALLEKAVAPDDPRLAVALRHRADGAVNAHRCRDALPDYERALAISEKRLGGRDVDSANSLVGIAMCWLELGDAGKALPYAERGLAIYEDNPESPATRGEARFTVAQALWKAGGDRRRALSLAEQAQAEYAQGGEADLAKEAAAWVRARRNFN